MQKLWYTVLRSHGGVAIIFTRIAWITFYILCVTESMNKNTCLNENEIDYSKNILFLSLCFSRQNATVYLLAENL